MRQTYRYTDEEIGQLNAELERLREREAALRAIIECDPEPPLSADGWGDSWRRLVFRMKGIARAALEQSAPEQRDADGLQAQGTKKDPDHEADEGGGFDTLST